MAGEAMDAEFFGTKKSRPRTRSKGINVFMGSEPVIIEFVTLDTLSTTRA
jgi:hypothetical protein